MRLDLVAEHRDRSSRSDRATGRAGVQRKVVTPNDFADLDTLEQQLLTFGRRYEQIAAPFQWKFTRQDLDNLLAKTDAQPTSVAA